MSCRFCKEDKEKYLGDGDLLICTDCAKLCKKLLNSKINKDKKIINFPERNILA